MAYDLVGIVQRSGTRKRSVAAKPVVPTKTRVDALASIYLEVPRAWQVAIREQLLPAYERAVATLRRDEEPVSMGLSAILQTIADAMGRVVVSLRPRTLRWLTDFGGWHTNRFAQTIQAAAGIDVRYIMSPTEIAQAIDIALERNVALISSVNEEIRTKVATKIWAGISQQTPRDAMAKELAQIIGSSRARARRIATDQTAKIGAALDEIRQKEAGLDEYMWRHSRKLHPRDWHQARDGKVFDWKAIPASDMPGVPPFCFPASEPVSWRDDVQWLYRHRYAGELVQIVTDSGKALEATPNHPVLTRSGWKAAKALNIGDEVIEAGDAGSLLFDVGIEQGQPRIGDLFETAQAFLGSVSTNGMGTEFHGDATVDEQIEIVDAKGGLLAHIMAALDEFGGEPIFKDAEIGLAALAGLRFSLQVDGGPDLAPDGVVGSVDLLQSLLWRHAVHDELGGGARASHLYAVALEHIGDGLPRYVNALADRFDAFARKVGQTRFLSVVLLGATARIVMPHMNVSAPAAEVVHHACLAEPEGLTHLLPCLAGPQARYGLIENVITRRWSGHVFNLGTVSGWYRARNIIVHNCGCKKQPYLNLDD